MKQVNLSLYYPYLNFMKQPLFREPCATRRELNMVGWKIVMSER